MNKPFFSLILPVYNEGDLLEPNIQKIFIILKKSKISWEVIFIDDKSSDNSTSTLKKLSKKLKNSRFIFHKKNLGRGQSVKDGIKIARGEICAFIDVDLEVSEKYIPTFINQIKKGSDFVVAKRYYKKNFNLLLRYILSISYAKLVKMILKISIDDTEAGYKFFRKKSIQKILQKTKDQRWFWDTEICAISQWEGLKLKQIPVLFVRKNNKKSTVRIIPDTFDYLVKITRFRLLEFPKYIKK